MKLNSRARYALNAMATISRSTGNGDPTSVRSLGGQTQISRAYLGHLLTQLVEAGLLRSIRGRRGGFLLARPAAEIHLGQIIEAVTGPINLIECIISPEACALSEVCACRDLYESLNEQILGVFNSYSLADLASQQRSSAAEIDALLRDHSRADAGAVADEAADRWPVPCRSLGSPSGV